MEDLENGPCRRHTFSADCPTRDVFDQIADKWSMMIPSVLDEAPTRFNQIKGRLEGISQKSLSQTLRKLERNVLIYREVLSTSPVAVQYGLSDLGQTLLPPFPSARSMPGRDSIFRRWKRPGAPTTRSL